MAITIKGNVVSVPRNCYDATLPWTNEMHDLAISANRIDSLFGFKYEFKNHESSSRFYERLLTKPNKRHILRVERISMGIRWGCTCQSHIPPGFAISCIPMTNGPAPLCCPHCGAVKCEAILS